MGNTINNEAIAKVLKREYERPLTRAYKVLPFANRKFEGDIAQKGDTVRVPYVRLGAGWNKNVQDSNRDIPNSDLEIGTYSLAVTQYMDIRFKISDKELSLLGKDLGTTQEVVRQIKDLAVKEQEDYFLNKMLTASDIPAKNKITGVDLTSANVYAEIEKISVVFDEQNVPADKRVLFVSPKNASIIRQSKLFDNLESGYRKRSEGEIGKIAGMTIVVTTAIADNKILAYQDMAGNFVEKLNFIDIRQAGSGNYYNILGGLFFDAGIFGESLKKVIVYSI
ncbi:hypothetical protein DLH72_05055 [Candidatus Gracilibacteria bacterium]|nr:MAG: hypothetical protein DLH72_05055 [Candidatus Gracilibacteria bacterium]